MKVSRIIFFGTPEFAIPSLEVFSKNKKYEVMVVTQPDQQAGRGKKMTPPAVKKFCDDHGLPCIQPRSIKKEAFLKKISEFKPDLILVAAYGRIFTQGLLDAAPLVLNVHASMLPRWRGASPISQSILHQDSFTGISIMKLVQELDAGPVMLQKKEMISTDDDTESLTKKLAQLGAKATEEALELIEKDRHQFVEQNKNLVTFAPILSVEDAKIDWEKTALEIQHHIRGYSPAPGAFSFDGNERIKIYKSLVGIETENVSPGTLMRKKKQLSVACKDRWLDLLELQRPGKTRQGVVDFLNGYSVERIQWK